MQKTRGHWKVFLLLFGIIKGVVAQDISSFSSGTLVFESVSNGQYQIEWKSDLTESDWRSDSPFQSITATQETTEVRMPLFFRVRWLNPPPFTIAGLVQYAGVTATNITNAITAHNASAGYSASTYPDAGEGIYSLSGLSNGVYQLSITVHGFFPYQEDVSVANQDVTHNIELQIPILPIAPTNHHVQAGTSITLEWPNDTPANIFYVNYYMLTNGATSIKIWRGDDTCTTLTDLAPGTYRWGLRAYFGRFVNTSGTWAFVETPVGHVADWQEFTITD